MSERTWERATISGLSVITILVVGWLVTLIVDLQRETRHEVEALAVQVGKLQVMLERCE